MIKLEKFDFLYNLVWLNLMCVKNNFNDESSYFDEFDWASDVTSFFCLRQILVDIFYIYFTLNTVMLIQNGYYTKTL